MTNEEDDSSNNNVDFVSNLSYNSLNYIFDCFIPVHLANVDLKHDKAANIGSSGKGTGTVPSISVPDNLTRSFSVISRSPNHQGYQGCFENTESLVINDKETFSIPGNVQVSRGYKIVGHIDTSKTHLGYLRVKSIPQENCPYPCVDLYILSCKTNLKESCHHIRNQTSSVSSSAIRIVENQLKGCHISGGSRTNIVNAFPFFTWPEEASEFSTRKRASQWPDTTLVMEVMEGGCLVVPSAHPSSSQPDVEWRYSFYNAEMKLLSSLNNVQIQAYMLFQLICEQRLDLPSILNSEHLRTVFLWTCERLPSELWSENNIAKCVLLLIDTLFHFLIQGCIPNYFIPSWNTIDHVSEDFVRDLCMKISSVRRNVLQPLLEFDTHFRMPYWPCSVKMVDILEPVLNSATSCLATEELTSKIIKSGSRLVITLLKEHSFAAEGKEKSIKLRNAGFKHATHALQRLEKYIAEPNRGLDFYVGMAQESGDPYIPFFEYLLEKFPTDPSVAVHHGNLACYYYSKASKATEPDAKMHLIKKTRNHFQQALKHGNCSDATMVDYANFLCRENALEEGITLLKTVVKRKNFMAWNSYNEDESETVDSEIQSEIKTFKILTLPSIAMAYYLLLSNYKNSVPACSQEESLQFFTQFLEVCSEIYHLYGRQSQSTKSAVATCFTLLGISGQIVEEYDMSSQAFAKAIEILPDYPTALLRKQIVDSLIEAIALSQE